jgi:hypothetical protein
MSYKNAPNRLQSNKQVNKRKFTSAGKSSVLFAPIYNRLGQVANTISYTF